MNHFRYISLWIYRYKPGINISQIVLYSGIMPNFNFPQGTSIKNKIYILIKRYENFYSGWSDRQLALLPVGERPENIHIKPRRQEISEIRMLKMAVECRRFKLVY